MEFTTEFIKNIIRKSDRFEEAIKICLVQHSMVHRAEMAQLEFMTLENELWEGLEESAFRTMLNLKDEATIAWCLWHLTRIEDITMNILVADHGQVINRDIWLEKMRVSVCDTGNAMTNEEIIYFSKSIDMVELINFTYDC